MQSIFKVNPDNLIEQVQQIADDKFKSLDRVLAEKTEQAQLYIEVTRDTKKQTGKVFRASGRLVVDGNSYYAKSREETIGLSIERVRDGLLRKVRASRGRTARLMRRGGSALKSLLRFGRK
ncbi:hypothetical protein MNBD_CPR01-392 [hydrothermal vent metagenome]|uniref:Uncharacterized protein n=1 Tax=hydrothermal vent metagenome TaxID=652676 RepID=A0A3B0UV86_9ZZZZ